METKPPTESSPLSPWLDMFAHLAGDAALTIPGLPGQALAVVAVALRLASDLALKGTDPIEHLERIHAADPDLQTIEGSWAELLRERFDPEKPA